MRRRAKKVRLTKAEQVAADIGKWQRAQERALVMERKAATLLKRSAVELARLHKRQAKLEAEAARVETTPVKLAVAVRTDGTEEIVPVAEPAPELSAFERHKGEPATTVKLKAPRKRKPKPSGLAESSADLASALIQAPPPAAEARQARMEALGFRRTGKRK